jgi:hypothetical protein
MSSRRTFFQILASAAAYLTLPKLAEAAPSVAPKDPQWDHWILPFSIPLDVRSDPKKFQRAIIRSWGRAVGHIRYGEDPTVVHRAGRHGTTHRSIEIRHPDTSYHALVEVLHESGLQNDPWPVYAADRAVIPAFSFWKNPVPKLLRIVEANPEVQQFLVKADFTPLMSV